MKKMNKIKVRVDQTNLPNKFHLAVQQHAKGSVHKNKKKYDRKSFKKIDY